MTTEPRELRSLTGLRALLAWWVVAFHFTRHLVPDDWVILKNTIGHGYLAVDVFFVLSGYVLMRGYCSSHFAGCDTARFYRRRWARIYPLYLLSLVVGAFASRQRFVDDLGTGVGRLRIALELLLLNAFCHVGMFLYNYGAWSLSVEAFFYAVSPVLLPWVLCRTRASGIALLGVCWLATFAAPALYAAVDPDRLGRPLALEDQVMGGWYLNFFPLQRLPEFVAGALAARIDWVPRRGAIAIATASLLAIIVSGAVPYAFLHSGVALPCIVVVVMGVASADRTLGGPIFVAFGRASYATYILHWPLFLLWSQFDPALWERPSHVLAFAAALAVSSLAAYRFVEEPLRRRLVR